MKEDPRPVMAQNFFKTVPSLQGRASHWKKDIWLQNAASFLFPSSSLVTSLLLYVSQPVHGERKAYRAVIQRPLWQH